MLHIRDNIYSKGEGEETLQQILAETKETDRRGDGGGRLATPPGFPGMSGGGRLGQCSRVYLQCGGRGAGSHPPCKNSPAGTL